MLHELIPQIVVGLNYLSYMLRLEHGAFVDEVKFAFFDYLSLI